jgi:hypothetical protein
MAEILEAQHEAEYLFGMDWYDPTCYSSEILGAKYEKMYTNDVVNQSTQLSDKQKQDLKILFEDFTRLFDGTLGVYPHKKLHIDFIPGAKPKHRGPYVIPRIHLAAVKKELDRLVHLKVLSPQGASKWDSPTLSLQRRTTLAVGSATYES